MGRAIISTRTYVLYPVYHVSLPDDSRLQNSNIVQLFSMLKKDDKSQQVVYYQVCRIWLFVLVRRSFKCKYSRLASGRTRYLRSRHRSGQMCKRRLTWLLPTTSMPMSWVRRSYWSLLRLQDHLRVLLFSGGYEFLMENCTSIGNHFPSACGVPHLASGC